MSNLFKNCPSDDYAELYEYETKKVPHKSDSSADFGSKISPGKSNPSVSITDDQNYKFSFDESKSKLGSVKSSGDIYPEKSLTSHKNDHAPKTEPQNDIFTKDNIKSQSSKILKVSPATRI